MENSVDATKSAHFRRREQVRRAQRYTTIMCLPCLFRLLLSSCCDLTLSTTTPCILYSVANSICLSFRNHRERKELYTRTLEKQLLDLGDEISFSREFEEASLTNMILKNILQTHIPMSDVDKLSAMDDTLMNDTFEPRHFMNIHIPQPHTTSTPAAETPSSSLHSTNNPPTQTH